MTALYGFLLLVKTGSETILQFIPWVYFNLGIIFMNSAIMRMDWVGNAVILLELFEAGTFSHFRPNEIPCAPNQRRGGQQSVRKAINCTDGYFHTGKLQKPAAWGAPWWQQHLTMVTLKTQTLNPDNAANLFLFWSILFIGLLGSFPASAWPLSAFQYTNTITAAAAEF